MNRLVRSLTLPLLARELTEQAARKRTCVVRTICALALTVVAMLVIYEEIVTRYERNPLTLIGQGRIVVEVLIICLFCGVFFLQPAITCGVITSEKERNTLGLLFLTRLGPWSLVLEKLISRLIPMATVLLLSLPLLAIAYSMGGVSLDYLWSAVWLLAVSAFQIGALALLCSTLCRTTASAFMRTYLVALVFYFGWPMLVILDIVDDLAKCSLFGTMIHPELVFFGPYLVFDERIGWPDVIPASVPIMASGMVFLIAARIALTRRAFVHQRHTAPRLFRTLDNVFGRMSSWLSGHRDGALPVTDTDIVDPVAWQESRRGGANRFSHQIYACIGATILLWILLACFSGSQTGRNNWGGEMLALISGAVWILALIAVCVRSASLVAGERSRQTLDVLLATPLSNREILFQKRRAVVRRILLAAIPFVSCTLFSWNWRSSIGLSRWDSSPLYVTFNLATFAIYATMISWLGTVIGLRVHNQIRAIVSCISVTVAWCLLPFAILIPMIISFEIQSGSAPGVLLLLSPVTAVVFNEVADLDDVGLGSEELAFLLNSILYITALVLIRNYCLTSLEQHLKRRDQESGPE